MLSTARDIIFLWVARMVMFGVELTGELPFTDVPIHSVVQAPDGRRMSKSLGTGIDPLELIDPSTGPTRCASACSAMASSQDVRFNEERVKQGRDLANKLWNASRLILQRVGDVEADAGAAETVEDRWIVSRLERLTESVTEQFDSFRFSPATLELYGAFWSELCDWYLELAKPRLYAEDNARVSAVLRARARADPRAAPPGHAVRHRGDLVAPARRARAARHERLAGGRRRAPRRARRRRALERFIEAVGALRSYRDDVGAKPGKPLRGVLAAEGYERPARAPRPARPVRAGRTPGRTRSPRSRSPAASCGCCPPRGSTPRRRAAAAKPSASRLEGEIERLEKKLSNEGFVQKAPPEVVEGERRKLEDYREALRRLDEA